VLQQDYQEQAIVYSTLCDYVHPNYGSNSLVSSGELGKEALSQPPSAFQAQIAFANACTVRCLELAAGYELEGSAELIRLDSRVEIASRDGERPTTVFKSEIRHPIYQSPQSWRRGRDDLSLCKAREIAIVGASTNDRRFRRLPFRGFSNKQRSGLVQDKDGLVIKVQDQETLSAGEVAGVEPC
jgi:hypothetical protein